MTNECPKCKKAWADAKDEYDAGGSPQSPPAKCTHGFVSPPSPTMTPDAKLVEEIPQHMQAALNELEFTGNGYDELSQAISKFHSLAAASAAREKAWHDNILAASGGHATTPDAASVLIWQLRDMLDVMKASTHGHVCGLPGFTWQPFEMRLTGPNGGCYASVWTNGTWHTWDENGTGGDNDVAPRNVPLALKQAEAAIVQQGWNVERKHPRERVEELEGELEASAAREKGLREALDYAVSYIESTPANRPPDPATYSAREHARALTLQRLLMAKMSDAAALAQQETK